MGRIQTERRQAHQQVSPADKVTLSTQMPKRRTLGFWMYPIHQWLAKKGSNILRLLKETVPFSFLPLSMGFHYFLRWKSRIVIFLKTKIKKKKKLLFNRENQNYIQPHKITMKYPIKSCQLQALYRPFLTRQGLCPPVNGVSVSHTEIPYRPLKGLFFLDWTSTWQDSLSTMEYIYTWHCIPICVSSTTVWIRL